MNKCQLEVGDWVELATARIISKGTSISRWYPADNREPLSFSQRIAPDPTQATVSALIYNITGKYDPHITLCFPQKPAGLFTHNTEFPWLIEKYPIVKSKLNNYNLPTIDIWATDVNSIVKHLNKKMDCLGCYCIICQETFETI